MPRDALLNHRACVQGSISGDGRGGATTLMITNYQPPKEPREHKEPDGVTSSSTSVSSAMDELSSKDKVRALNRLAQKGSTRQNMNLFSPDSGSEASDHSEPHNFTVWHKRAPPEPPTHADQLAVQGKRIDEEVERAQKLLDVRKQLYAMTQSDASKQNQLDTLNELARLLGLDRNVFHPEYEHLFTSDLFVTPTAKRQRQRSNCSNGTAHCDETANTTCEKCDKIVCGSCARRLCVTLFGNQEEEFHFCTEHEGDAPAYKNQAPEAEVFSFEYPPEPTLEDAPHMCNVCKIDVRRVGHDTAIYVLECVYPALYPLQGTCIKCVCNVCSNKLHPYRDDQDSETLRGCFCVKHCSPVLHVLEDIAQHFSDPQRSWDQRNPY